MWGRFSGPCTAVRSYFEAEMGLTYGKMPVPPKELCISAGRGGEVSRELPGPGFRMATQGGQGLAAWRQ